MKKIINVISEFFILICIFAVLFGILGLKCRERIQCDFILYLLFTSIGCGTIWTITKCFEDIIGNIKEHKARYLILAAGVFVLFLVMWKSFSICTGMSASNRTLIIISVMYMLCDLIIVYTRRHVEKTIKTIHEDGFDETFFED